MVAIDYLIAAAVAMVGSLALVQTTQQSLALAGEIHRDVAVDNLLSDTSVQLQIVSSLHRTMEPSERWLDLVGYPLCDDPHMPQSQWCDRHRVLDTLLGNWVVCLERTSAGWLVTVLWPAHICDSESVRRQRAIRPL